MRTSAVCSGKHGQSCRPQNHQGKFAAGQCRYQCPLGVVAYSLRTHRKPLAGTHHPDRDRQFRCLTRIRRWSLTPGLPVISVATKKKELVGNFQDPGRCWRTASRDVLDHDFARSASGRRVASSKNVTRVSTPKVAAQCRPFRGSGISLRRRIRQRPCPPGIALRRHTFSSAPTTIGFSAAPFPSWHA